MKTGYVYIIALSGRWGRVLRLATSLRHPRERVRRLSEGPWRARRPRLVAFEFAEDLVGARAQVRAALRHSRSRGHPRTFRCSTKAAVAALARAAEKQAALRKARFHPDTGLLIDPEVEIAGPVAAISQSLAAALSAEVGGRTAKLDLYLHPYMVGAIASILRQTQSETKIPDEYLPEILRDIAWRIWRFRIKAGVFARMTHRTRREQSYLDLARFEAGRQARRAPPVRFGGGFATYPQLVSFVREPAHHLNEAMTGYAEALARAPAVKARTGLFRAAQLALAIAAIFLVDALLQGGRAENWLSGLLTVFVAGTVMLAFNLYERPNLTGGLGILSRREVEVELSALRATLRAGAPER